MTNFARSIQAFQTGECSAEDLLNRLDTTLTNNESGPADLLTELMAEHTQQPLDDELFATLLGTINEHLQNTTGSGVASAALQAPGSSSTAVNPAIGVTDDAGTATQAMAGAHAQAANPINTTHSPPGPAVGDIVNNRFELEALLGKGGMSRVYRAVDRRKLEAKSRAPHVALKVLDVSARNRQAAFIALQREAQKSQQLQHRNIVRVFDFDRDEDTVFITMEYLEGKPLSDLIRAQGGKGLPVERCMRLIAQMGAALQHAHSQRIVHADFKPNNVIVMPDDTVKVIDFGIARAYSSPEDTAGDMTAFDPRELGALTPAYASPEMFDNQEPDPKDDVYALGCVAYELVTGLHPFAKRRATVAQAAGMLPDRPEAVTGPQWNAIQKALAFERSERTASVAAFLEAFLPPDTNIATAAESPGSRKWLGIAAGAVIAVAAYGYWSINKPAMPGAGAIAACADCPALVTVPAGAAMIGSPISEPFRRASEGPRFQAVFTEPLLLGETEVTVGQFKTYVEATGTEIAPGCRSVESGWRIDPTLSWINPGFRQGDAHPVTCVSWNDAQGYLAWLNDSVDGRYRLPTEAEWEYAARSGAAGTSTWAENSQACRHANVADSSAARRYPGYTVAACDDGHVHTAPVKQRQANAFGLFDMQGNVFEWTQDCWKPSYAGSSTAGQATEAAAAGCTAYVLRGGSFHSAPSEQRLAYRNYFDGNYRANTFGFRVLLDSHKGAGNADGL